MSSKIVDIQKDLFEAPIGTILAHACNTKGVWGSGIAKEFAKRFPKARDEYTRICKEKGTSLIGTCLMIPVDNHTIACLFTSENYGSFKDSPQQILKNTQDAVAHMIALNRDNKEIHMCKINSGLFGVDWNDTKLTLDSFNYPFTVYSLK
jgi:ADP-ribose 1''-phosphate phosphatase